jgi:hypothetical protein
LPRVRIVEPGATTSTVDIVHRQIDNQSLSPPEAIAAGQQIRKIMEKKRKEGKKVKKKKKKKRTTMICWQIDRCWNGSVETLLAGPVVCMLRAIIHYKSSHRRGPIGTADAFDSFPENNCADYAYK